MLRGSGLELCLFPLTNSGLYLFFQGTGVLIDGLYGPGPWGDFSPFPSELHAQMLRGSGLFAHLNALLFTHAHGDHCDSALLAQLRRIRPELPIYGHGLPRNTWGAEMLGDGVLRLTVGGFSFVLLDTAHQRSGSMQGNPLFDLPNCMVVIQCGQKQLLLTADAALGQAEEGFAQRFGTFDLVFCNPIQLAQQETRQFFQALKPGRILITHLPAPQDDKYHLWMQARQLCHRQVGRAVPEIAAQMAWLDGKAPEWIS